jgi:hypothetical protein
LSKTVFLIFVDYFKQWGIWKNMPRVFMSVKSISQLNLQKFNLKDVHFYNYFKSFEVFTILRDYEDLKAKMVSDEAD